MGAPFLLATLGMFVLGASALSFRRGRRNGTEIKVEEDVIRRDMIYFLIFFTLVGGAGIVTASVHLKVALTCLLLGGYAFYVHKTLKLEGEECGAAEFMVVALPF
jgi:cation:H+ antiporter